LTALVALVGYPVTLTAGVRMVQGRRRGRSGDMVVEAGLLALAFGLCAYALLAPAVQPVPFSVTLAAIALPAADVAVLVVTGRLMSLPGERPDSYLYLLIGFLGLFGAHGLQAAAATWSLPWTSPTIEVLRVLSFGALGAAALHPSMEHLFEPLAQDPPKFSRAHLVLVGIAVIAPAAVALVFLDLDGFKAINDRLGHACGDLVLQAVAARIGEILRDEDTVARLGGDEFVVLLPHLRAPGDAIVVAERLLAAFEAHFEAGANTVPVTPSIGVAV